MDSTARLVALAATEIDSGALDEHGVEALAAKLGITSRHLRRAMEAELGVSPIEYAQTRRLALAKQLLHDTSLSLTEVALAAGFGSVRRFNAVFKERFARAPSDVRRRADTPSDTVTLRLEFRPPFAWESLLSFLRGRAIPGVESVDGGEYRRTVRLGPHVGWLSVRRADGEMPALFASLSTSLVPRIAPIVARLRALFDLDAEPDAIAEHLRKDARFTPMLVRTPGLRLPGAFDPFEMSVRAVLGQQVSVKGARTLCGRLVAAFGRSAERGDGSPAELHAFFPTASELAAVSIEELCAIGLPQSRAATLVGLATEVATGRMDLTGAAPMEETLAALQALRGIGPWTAQYVAMRALRWPDAFVAGDLGVRKALGAPTLRAVEAMGQRWRPWRGYAVMHLWNSLSLSSGGL